MDNQQAPYLGMEPQHREKILNNTERLVSLTDYATLLRACFDERLLNRAMLNKIEAVSDKTDERHKRLFWKITKRGPDAFQKLKNILMRHNYNSALKLLIDDENYNSINNKQGRTTPANANNNNINVNVNNGIEVTDNRADVKDASHTRAQGGGCVPITDDNDEILQPYDKEIKPKRAFEVIKSSHIHVGDETIPAYSMKSQHNRGVLFMINIIDFVDKEDYRNGAKEDSQSLLHLFKALGFTLFAFENLKHDELKKRINQVINSEYVRKAECFVMALMTHGNMDKHNNVEIIELSDGSVMRVDEILKCFNNDCLNLLNKPKIFLFPFCRGVNHDYGRTNKTQADSMGVRKSSLATADGPRVSDILICYATLPGFKAYRDPHNGSWYIQCFCENMAKRAHNTHFEDLLKMVQKDSSSQRGEENEMQTANYNNMSFNKKLYFNPGVYEEIEASV